MVADRQNRITCRLLLLCVLLLLTLFVCACGMQEPPEIPVTPVPETEAPIEITGPPPTEKPETEDKSFIVWFEGTKYRSAPVSEDINVLGTLPVGASVFCLQDRGEFMLVELEDGQQVWIAGWYLKAADEALAEKMDQTSLEKCMERESFQPIEDEPVYQCTANLLNCRAEPEPTATILCQVISGTRLIVYGVDNGFYLCRLPGGSLCYCTVEWLTDKLTYAEYPGAVDLRAYLPEAQFDLLFASSNNVTGKPMYPAVPLMEKGTAEMLLDAYQTFLEDGYAIKIYDAYRPFSAQIKLYDIVQDPRYIADPNIGYSWHQRGRAVDMSLIDLSTGKELAMPSPMHAFRREASRSLSSQWSEEVRANVEYMTKVMMRAGFTPITTEWWHFEYAGPGRYLSPDINLYSLQDLPVSDANGQ